MFAKLFSRITESSLMEEPIEVRYAFVMLLAICDPTGHVIGTDIAIARRINMPVSDFQRCIAELRDPDPDSNSKEEDGRRVVVSEGERGYRVVNYLTYRDMRDEDDRREYMRDYMQKYRERKALQNGKTPVKRRKQKLTVLANAEGEAYADVKEEGERDSAHPPKRKGALEEIRAFCKELGLPESDGDASFHKWEGNGWKNGQLPIKCWRSTIRAWRANGYMPSQKANGKNGHTPPADPLAGYKYRKG